MYLPGQVIFSFDKMRPVKLGSNVWALDSYPRRHTHFVTEGEKLFVPKTVAQARALYKLGAIAPHPTNISSHCPLCHNWYNNCKCDKVAVQTILTQLLQ